jgi:hypothetical protein
MADATIPVAAITAAAVVSGALVSPFVLMLQRSFQTKRSRTERLKTSCKDLRRAVASVRIQVANNHDYRGGEMAERLAKLRHFASDAALHAFDISMNAPKVLADAAKQLSEEADRLVMAAEKSTDLALGGSSERPDFTELDTRTEAFTAAAVHHFSRPS